MNSNKGFTLIELIVVTVLMCSFVSLACGSIVILFNKGFRVTIDQSSIRLDTNMVRSDLTRSLRNIKNSKSILNAQTGSISFKNTEDESIGYSLNGNTLIKSINTDTYTLANNITGFNLDYLDASSNNLGTPTIGDGVTTDIRFINLAVGLGLNSAHTTINLLISPRNIR